MRRTVWFVREHNEGVYVSVMRARMRAHYAVQMLVIPGRCGSSACAAGYEPRLQFVINIDEQLFASFAPRRLKRALAKSAELVVASPPTLHGLDLAPVLKLIAALTMDACLVGMVIVPQNSLLDDAKLTLCGTRRAHLLLGSGRPPLRTVVGVRRRVGQLGLDERQVRPAVLGRPERRGR